MNDRASEAYAQSVFESLYEDSKTLKACAKLLADSIRLAHQMGEACWSLTLFPHEVRLDVGPVEVLVCRFEEVHMVLDGSQNLTLNPEINRFIKGPEIFYPIVPVSQYFCDLPAKLVDVLYSVIAEDHQAFIRLTAKRRKTSSWQKSFSSGMILYLNKLFGISLPMPSYFSGDTDTGNSSLTKQWKLNDYVQYHNSEAMGVSCLEFTEDERFGISTTKPASNLKGNRIWLIGGIGKPREYYLCYNFIVDRIEPTDGDFKFVVAGKEGTFLKPPILLNDFPWFKDFLKSQQNFSMGLRKIDLFFVDQLEKVLSGQVSPNSSIDEQAQKVGGGLGNSETNRKVEQAAVLFVMNYYKQNGWSVKSVESEKCGFDLLCIKENTQEHVEVKGVQGELVSFIITSGEVKQSQSDECFVLCIVTTTLTNPKLYRVTSREFQEQFSLEAISYRASLKQR